MPPPYKRFYPPKSKPKPKPSQPVSLPPTMPPKRAARSTISKAISKKRKASESLDLPDEPELESSSPRFTIKLVDPHATKEPKRKKGRVADSSNAPLKYRWHKDLFEGVSLTDVCYTVKPSLAAWEKIKSYRKFTFEGETFQVGECIYVQPASEQNADPDAPVSDWVGKILDVRGEDTNNVFVHVVWLYRPEDLAEGRQPYHGANELIASNDTAIIEAATVQGIVKVQHWAEQADLSERLDYSELFWRQTYDVMKKEHQLSELPRYCVDNMPYNPDDMLIQCDHCKQWLHGHCLEAKAARDASRDQEISTPEPEASTKKKKPGKALKAPPPPALYEAKLVQSETNGQLSITIRSKGAKKPGKTNEFDIGVLCLLCDRPIKTVEGPDPETSEDDPNATVDKPVTPRNPDTEDEASADESSNAHLSPDEEPTLRNVEFPSAKKITTASTFLQRVKSILPKLNSDAIGDADGEKEKEKDSEATSQSATPCPEADN